MGTAKLLRYRHLRCRRILPPSISSPISPFVPPQNPAPFRSSNLFNVSRFAGILCPRPWNPNLLQRCGNISYRSFSWSAWAGAPESGGSVDSSGAGSEFSPADGYVTGSEPSDLQIDALGMVGESVGESVWYIPLVRPVISLLDGFHDLTGLPWWVVILTSTLALRAALLPMIILQLKKVGEIAVLFPKLPPPLPPPLSGRSIREQYMLFRKKRQELGCPSFLWNFASFAVQFPCFLLWMYSIRRMCLDHHPGFESGGTLWFQNLTDFPHGILGPVFPILIAGLHYVNVQIPFHTFKAENLHGILGLLAKYYKLYLEVLAIPLLLIGFQIPQGSLLYWVTNSSLTLVQQLSLRNPYVREKLGLPVVKVLAKNTISTENVLHDGSCTLGHKISAETLSPEKLLDVGLKYFAAGCLDEALPLLRHATEKDPELVKALVAMGEICCSKGSFAEAVEYFERAISKIQEEELGLLVLAYYGAGFSHILQGNKAEGIEHLKRIAQLKEPEEPMNKACYYRGLVMLGSELFNGGERTEAAKYLRRAAAYDPGVKAYVKECEDG